MFKYLAVVSSLLIFVEAQQKWHTSQIRLTKLYDLQNHHFNAFDKFLDLETIRLKELKSYVAAVYEWYDHKITNKDYSHNHLDYIQVIKQIHHQLLKIENLKKNEQSMEALREIDEDKNVSDDHILWTHRAMRRLQRFYSIPASVMSEGRLDDKIIGGRMDACECFVMAKYCFEDNDVFGIIDWAIETYNKWENDSQPQCVDIAVLNFYIISSSVYTGFNIMKLLNPSGSNYPKDTEKFSQYYYLMTNELIDMDRQRTLDVFENYYDLENKYFDDKFRRSCKVGYVSRKLTKFSKCRYQTKNSYYRILMPFKEEDINSDPLIKIYHDVLYEDEILKIKTKALENMEDATIISGTSGKFEEQSRSGQVSWMKNDEFLGSLDNRIESFTEYSTKTAEDYQIVNYGLGGHYFPHYDSFNKEIKKEFGNRLITVLLYLTDIQNDGYTSFPELNIISPAEKGAALVFHNMHLANGERHLASVHGSCPLLKGNKWIMTRWLYEGGQNLLYDWKNKS